MILDAAQNKRESINCLYLAECTKLYSGVRFFQSIRHKAFKLKKTAALVKFHCNIEIVSHKYVTKENLELFRVQCCMIFNLCLQDLDRNVNT